MTLLSTILSPILDIFFIPLENQKAKFPRQQKIPPIVYQTWETQDFGRKHAKSMVEFRRKNDDLDFFLFDRHERDCYMQKTWGDRLISEIYFRSEFGALKADIFRYCLIYDKGGYYFDISKGLGNRLTSLHSPDAEGIITYENSDYLGGVGPAVLSHPGNVVVQWGFGFAPKAGLLELHIQRLEASFDDFLGKTFENPKMAILEFTGPIAFTRSLHIFARSAANMANIVQRGKDFDGYGIFALPGSGSRYFRSPSYANVKNRAILK
jgi:mannosyltransferase OCH1-like enzyme